MQRLLEAINRGILRGLNEQNIELLSDLDDGNLDQLDSIQTKSVNNKIDGSIKPQQLIDAIQTGELPSGLKQIINDPNNFDKFKGLIKANDKDHLEELIKIGQKLLGDDGNFNWIDTSGITDMSKLFYNSYFNGHIELWDVSNVTNMREMFKRAYKFNQPIGGWDVSNVRDMYDMFAYTGEFNQPIGNWDVSNVRKMIGMFFSAEKFNQPIGDWDVRNVTSMAYMFCDAESFNQNLSKWKLDYNCIYDKMFCDCRIYNSYKPRI